MKHEACPKIFATYQLKQVYVGATSHNTTTMTRNKNARNLFMAVAVVTETGFGMKKIVKKHVVP